MRNFTPALLICTLLIPTALAGTARLTEAAADPAASCIDAKLKASGKAAQKLLTCYSKAAKKGVAVDSVCLDKAAGALPTAFSKSEAKGGCLTTGDVGRVAGLVDGIVARTLLELLPNGPTVTSCSSAKLKAAGKRAAGMLKAHGKTVKTASAAKLGATITKTDEKFDSGFAKAETKGDCQTVADTAAVGATVDAALDGIYGELRVVDGETVGIASAAAPAETPGSAGADENDYPNLVTQLGSGIDLNNATYTRYYYQPDGVQPEAILVLIPGFEGGAASFKILAENLISRALEDGRRIEVWAFDRRGHQLEDLVGQDIAEGTLDAQLLLDWYYGGELGLPLSPSLPGRRAIFHDPQADTAFMANWTNLVFSRDIDAVIEAARSAAAGQNVFLGGHSAGTGFTARYASTDFDLTGLGPANPGYEKVRGLVLIEGGGGSSSGTPLTEDQLDLIEDKADGGLFHAVRDNAPRCADGTPCTVATQDTDCNGIGEGKCVEPTTAYATNALLNPRILAAGEISAIQAMTDPDTGENLVTVDQGAPGNNAVEVVPEIAGLAALGTGTAFGGLGAFLDDDGFISQVAPFVRTSVGAPGPVVGGLKTWQDITEGPMPLSVLPDNGAAPIALPAGVWGPEKEVTRIDRMITTFFAGGTNFTDWYYPSAGQSVTSGLPSMDSTQLSVGRGRRDIENLTQAANIDVPVICVGGSNGLTPVPQSFLAFAQSIGTCSAPSCDGSTPRVVDELVPNPAFPTLGDVDGGFEVHITEGIAHVDIVTAEDDADNNVVGPLLAFMERNIQ